MINIKEYVENVLITAVQAVFPGVERLVYTRYDRPVFRKWDALYIELAPDSGLSSRVITLDVTGMDIEGIRKTVTDSLNSSVPKRPLAATNGGCAACPRCEQLITNRSPHCEWCGQAIDWRILC